MSSTVSLAAHCPFQTAVRGGATITELMAQFPGWGPRTRYVDARIMARDGLQPYHKRKGDKKPGMVAGFVPPATETLLAGEKHEQTADSWNIELPRTRIKSLDELLEVCEVDTSLWEVERFVCNKWEMGSKDSEGRAQVEPLYQVKAWLKKKRLIEAVKAEIAALIEDAKQSIPPIATPACTYRSEGVLLELSIYDLHMAKLAWAPECGVSYDLKIAEHLFNEALEDLLSRAALQHVARIVFPIGNDLLHYDNKRNQTTGGTPLDSDTRYGKTFTTTRRMLTRAIERCRDLAPVDVLVVPGNHDEQSAFALGDALDCYFHATSTVSVDNSPALRKYYQHGRVMLQFTHGANEKPSALAQIAAAEKPAMWGETRYREAHIGHLHKTALDEMHGFRVRWLPSLCAPDAWHHGRGFVQNLRSAEAFLWSAERGLTGNLIYTVPDVEASPLAA